MTLEVGKYYQHRVFKHAIVFIEEVVMYDEITLYKARYPSYGDECHVIGPFVIEEIERTHAPISEEEVFWLLLKIRPYGS